MNKDNIDWGKTKISTLFYTMFIPTLLGMLLASTINIADGFFVGQGVGSDALAAVNIVAPFFLLTTGIGLMFGCGASIVASVHLSHGSIKSARINVTQAFASSLPLMIVLAAAVIIWQEETARLMGCTTKLMPYVTDYMRWIIPAMPFGMLMSIGLFIIRLDGSPKYAMMCNIIPPAINVVLDYIFVFPLNMGIGGAALATGLAEVIGSFLIIYYMLFNCKVLHLYPLKISHKGFRLMLRNVFQQIRLGAPSIIGEFATACMMFTGNYMFLEYLGEDGIAAFCVVCYCFPLVFMVGSAIAQSAQPIISFNHGAGLTRRVKSTMRLSLTIAVISGIAVSAAGFAGSQYIVAIFLPDTTAANHIACAGLPYFSIAFVLFTINLVCIGYYQSLENYGKAAVLMLLRGAIFVIPLFWLMPHIFGIIGLWTAVPVSEALTLLIIMIRK